MKKTVPVLGAALFLISTTFAGPLTFNFAFDNADTGAMATGQFTIDSSLVATVFGNSASAPDSFPMADLTGFSLTVSGAGAGNGTFLSSDFDNFVFWSAGANFDFSQNLVGQPTTQNSPFNPWGTPDTSSGDFNFLNANGPPAPTGDFFFSLGANGDTSDVMTLTTLQQTPEPGSIALVGLGVLALLGVRMTFKNRSSKTQ